MKIRRLALLAAIAVALVVAFAAQRPEPVRASAPIYQALDSLKSLDANGFAKVVHWASNGASPVYGAMRDYQYAEAGINALPNNQRRAILQWLTGNGREALYAQGVSDSDIGSRRPGADYAAATPTPDPYRDLKLVTDSFDEPSSGPITVINGFGAAKRDGTSATVCVSFKNNAPQPATSVTFAFSLKDNNGRTLGHLELERTGTFSTGIGIYTWDSYQSWRTQTHKGFAENCATRNSGVAAMPILEARVATYHVRSVTFADGTSWNAPASR